MGCADIKNHFIGVQNINLRYLRRHMQNFLQLQKWKYNWQAPCDTSVLEFSSDISKKQANSNNRENSGSKSTSIYLELNIQQRIWPFKNTEGIAKDTF